MQLVDAVERDQVNKSQGFKFRGIDQVYNELHDKMAKVGVFTIPIIRSKVINEKTTKSGTVMSHVYLEIKYVFACEDGSSLEAVVWGEATDSGDKAINKAMSIAHKYALLQIFMIPTEEDKDPDYNSTEFKKHSQEVQPKIIDSGTSDLVREFVKKASIAFKTKESLKEFYSSKKINDMNELKSLSHDDLVGLIQELDDLIRVVN